MKSIEIAHQLRIEANHLLFANGYDCLFRKYGQVIYTGSYVLDLMAWPDIDLQLALHHPAHAVAAMSELTFELSKRQDVALVKFEKEINQRIPSLPNGLYVGIKVKTKFRDQLFKLDIWALDEHDREKNRLVMQQISGALDDSKRLLILEMKQRLMTSAGRTPSLSGYHLYQAILFEGLSEEEQIREYLKKRGIKDI